MTEQQPPAPSEREWIPVPPPHPAAQAAAPGRGLGLAAMAVGLVAALTAILSAAYLPVASVAAVVLGLVAAALAIVALVKRQRPRGAWITGLAAGALAAVSGVVVAVLSVGLALVSAIGGPGQTERGEGGEWRGEDAPRESLIVWPQNMATGGILFGEDLMPAPSAALEFGEAPAMPRTAREAGVLDIRVYVDYRCPYCSIFEQTSGDLLAELADTGAATVEVVPLTFLDRAAEGSRYSSRAAGAVACIVDGQPDAAWSAHRTLLMPTVQPVAGPGLTNEDLVVVLDDAVGGLSSEVIDCIESERFAPFAEALNEWVFMTPVPNAIDESVRVTGTPFVLVNGVPYGGDPGDADAFRQFVTDALAR